MVDKQINKQIHTDKLKDMCRQRDQQKCMTKKQTKSKHMYAALDNGIIDKQM